MLGMTEAEPSLLKLSDGLSVRFQKIGSGPPFLLIHTIRTQLEYFRSLAPLLARSHTVYVIDLPGHGHSPIDPGASFDEPYFRQAVTRFIEELNLSSLTIVGESIGGALALTVAAALPHRVKRVFNDIPTVKELIDRIMTEAEQIIRQRLTGFLDGVVANAMARAVA